MAANANPERFEALSVGTARTIRLHGPLEAPCYWFERHIAVREADDTYTINTGEPTIHLVVDGTPSVLFYMAGSRLASCTFAYHLTPWQLEKAVLVMKRAKLGRHIEPAAEYALKTLPPRRRPILEEALQELVPPRQRRKRKRLPSTRD